MLERLTMKSSLSLIIVDLFILFRGWWWDCCWPVSDVIPICPVKEGVAHQLIDISSQPIPSITHETIINYITIIKTYKNQRH